MHYKNRTRPFADYICMKKLCLHFRSPVSSFPSKLVFLSNAIYIILGVAAIRSLYKTLLLYGDIFQLYLEAKNRTLCVLKRLGSKELYVKDINAEEA